MSAGTDTDPNPPSGRVLRLGGRRLSLDRPLVMGVLNVTPDSFSDGGRFFDPRSALAQGRRMIGEGADIIDVGAESTRPGATSIPTEKELRRLLPVLEPLLDDGRGILSVDTSNPRVAEEALRRGVPLINDVRGLRDPELREMIGKHCAAAVIMHMLGEPETMQNEPEYGDVVKEVKTCLARQAELAAEAGIQQVIIDPGIGFGKTTAHNLELLRNLPTLRDLGHPICLGVSRKAFIGRITGASDPLDRLEGTIAANVLGLLGGADILRVHDVRAAVRTIGMVMAYRNGDGNRLG